MYEDEFANLMVKLVENLQVALFTGGLLMIVAWLFRKKFHVENYFTKKGYGLFAKVDQTVKSILYVVKRKKRQANRRNKRNKNKK